MAGRALISGNSTTQHHRHALLLLQVLSLTYVIVINVINEYHQCTLTPFPTSNHPHTTEHTPSHYYYSYFLYVTNVIIIYVIGEYHQCTLSPFPTPNHPPVLTPH